MAEGYEEPPNSSLQLQIVSLPHINNLTLVFRLRLPIQPFRAMHKWSSLAARRKEKARGRRTLLMGWVVHGSDAKRYTLATPPGNWQKFMHHANGSAELTWVKLTKPCKPPRASSLAVYNRSLLLTWDSFGACGINEAFHAPR